MTEQTGAHARLRFQPGDMSNGYVLTSIGAWELLAQPAAIQRIIGTSAAAQPAATVEVAASKAEEPLVPLRVPPWHRRRGWAPWMAGGLVTLLLLAAIGSLEQDTTGPATTGTVTADTGLPMAAAELLGRARGGGEYGDDLSFTSMTGNYATHRGELLELLGSVRGDRDVMVGVLEWYLAGDGH